MVTSLCQKCLLMQFYILIKSHLSTLFGNNVSQCESLRVHFIGVHLAFQLFIFISFVKFGDFSAITLNILSSCFSFPSGTSMIYVLVYLSSKIITLDRFFFSTIVV